MTLLNLNPVLETLSELSDDSFIPRNIRSKAELVSELLQDEAESVEARKNRALQHLEDMSTEINLDMSIRTIIYQALSMVESLSGNTKV
jgi:uncharacterized protein (UPF0147 family)